MRSNDTRLDFALQAAIQTTVKNDASEEFQRLRDIVKTGGVDAHVLALSTNIVALRGRNRIPDRKMLYHVVTDAQGTQTALPCTEALVTLDGHRIAVQRGYMPVMAAKGRDEVRLGSFNGLSGAALMGAWSDQPRPAADLVMANPTPAGAALANLDDQLAGFDDPGPGPAGDDGMDAALIDLLNSL